MGQTGPSPVRLFADDQGQSAAAVALTALRCWLECILYIEAQFLLNSYKKPFQPEKHALPSASPSLRVCTVYPLLSWQAALSQA